MRKRGREGPRHTLLVDADDLADLARERGEERRRAREQVREEKNEPEEIQRPWLREALSAGMSIKIRVREEN